MSQVTNTNNTTSTFQPTTASAINDVNLDDFLDLMITELQNQDPLNPLQNDQLLAQISQIRQVGATDKLTETLDAVLLGQNITSATNLIGAEIDAISDDNQRVTGVVDRITISDGKPKLHLEEGAQIKISDEPGDLEAGSYLYRVVWQDPKSGKLLGVETEQLVSLSEGDNAVSISNLPLTDQPKQIYRTKKNGDGQYFLVDTLTSGTTSNYIDTTADADLSSTVLTRTPQLIDKATRSFQVSLENVGEIRPPQ